MSKVLKWAGIGVGGFVAVLLIAAAIVWFAGGGKLKQSFEVTGHTLAIPLDSATLATGARLAIAYGCRDCHGDDLGGTLMIDAPAFAVVAAPNLTRGRGGIGEYSTIDWERAIRHGVRPDGSGLVVMPSDVYHGFADNDIAALIAYAQTVPPVDREFARPRFGPIGRMAAMMSDELVPASHLDHDAPHRDSIAHTASLEFGTYLGTACAGCHGEDYSGSEAGMGFDVPVANITPDPTTGLGTWTLEDFYTAMREGRRPDGSAIDSAMPWYTMAALTDEELEGLWMFLQSRAPVVMDRRADR